MKRIIYKASIIVPLAMIFYSFIEPFAFCVPEIGLYMETWSSRVLIVMVTVVWLCCSPFRRGTCNGTITELLFNIVPVEIVLMLAFAQCLLNAFPIGDEQAGDGIAIFIDVAFAEDSFDFRHQWYWPIISMGIFILFHFSSHFKYHTYIFFFTANSSSPSNIFRSDSVI